MIISHFRLYSKSSVLVDIGTFGAKHTTHVRRPVEISRARLRPRVLIRVINTEPKTRRRHFARHGVGNPHTACLYREDPACIRHVRGRSLHGVNHYLGAVAGLGSVDAQRSAAVDRIPRIWATIVLIHGSIAIMHVNISL